MSLLLFKATLPLWYLLGGVFFLNVSRPVPEGAVLEPPFEAAPGDPQVAKPGVEVRIEDADGVRIPADVKIRVAEDGSVEIVPTEPEEDE